MKSWVADLHDAKPQVRRQAVLKLGNVGDEDPAVADALAEALHDTDPARALRRDPRRREVETSRCRDRGSAQDDEQERYEPTCPRAGRESAGATRQDRMTRVSVPAMRSRRGPLGFRHPDLTA